MGDPSLIVPVVIRGFDMSVRFFGGSISGKFEFK